jgi:hypothetical protein
MITQILEMSGIRWQKIPSSALLSTMTLYRDVEIKLHPCLKSILDINNLSTSTPGDEHPVH